jgi:hypothetical protein
MQKEKLLQNNILSYLNRLDGAFAQEIYNGGTAIAARGNRIIYKANGPFRKKGFPDIFFLWKNRVILIETKTKDGKLSKDQTDMHERICSCGGTVWVVRSLEDLIHKIGLDEQ